jgi:hypothetical protein
MIDIGIGFSSVGNAVLAAEEAVRAAKNNKTNWRKIDLALFLSTTEISSSSLVKALNNLLGGIPTIGLNAAAIISDHGLSRQGVVIALLSFPEGVYCTTAYTKDLQAKAAIRAGEELGEKLLYGFKNIQRNLGLIFFDKIIEDGPNFILGLQEHLGRSFPCLGGMTSDTDHSLKTVLCFNQTLMTEAACGILWGGKLTFGLGIKHGWKPLGKPHQVTDARGNIIKTIDGEPAAKIYEDYLACDMAKLKKDLNRLSVSYPIGIFIPGEDEYLLRNVIKIGEDDSLLCQGNVPNESVIRLMISTKETCLEATRQAVEEAQQNLTNPVVKFSRERTSKLALAFVSVKRLGLLRRDAQKEWEIIRNGLEPNTRLIGLYTYAELAPLKTSSYKGQIYFHNQTVSILIIEG